LIAAEEGVELALDEGAHLAERDGEAGALHGAVLLEGAEALDPLHQAGLHLAPDLDRLQAAAAAGSDARLRGAAKLLIERARGRLPATLVVHYVDADERVSLDPSAEAVAATEQAASATAAIRAASFPPKPECGCETCAYSWVCDA